MEEALFMARRAVGLGGMTSEKWKESEWGGGKVELD